VNPPRRLVATALVGLLVTAGAALAAGPADAGGIRPTRSVAGRAGPPPAKAIRPSVVADPIPFPDHRKTEMAAYSWRHYRQRTWRLTAPKVIVEHYTDGGTYAGARATMAHDTPNLGELPGVCVQFVVDTDGTIYQTVSTRIRCRHTIGLNQTAIGIEHVGTSDASVMDNARQRRASLRLTLWLIDKYGIKVRNVIGHGESLMSPLRHERYPSWKCQTHTDFSHQTMSHYRRLLRRRATALGIPAGPPPRWVDLGC
jgi:N-acetylmuramoyl-L-alanine amidase